MDFYENYRFGGRFFLSPEFCFRLISQTFRLEIGQREGLLRRIIVFRPHSIVSASEMVFYKNFRFGAFLALEFRVA